MKYAEFPSVLGEGDSEKKLFGEAQGKKCPKWMILGISGVTGVICGRSGVILKCRITKCNKTFCQIPKCLNGSVVSKRL